MNAAMMLSEALSFSAVVRLFFPSSHWHGGHCLARIFSGCHAGHDVRKSVPAKPKAKTTPAHQGKFLSAPLSPSASACAAHTVKGRCALRFASLHYVPDLLARLRPSLLTTAAPREIFLPGRSEIKAIHTAPVFPPCTSPLSPSMPPSFPGSSLGWADVGGFSLLGQHRALSVGVYSVSLLHGPCFPPMRRAFSGCGAFAFRKHTFRLPHVGLFVRHHPGGPAYVSYRRSASYFTAGEWLRPFEPPRKFQRQDQRREKS